MIVLGGVHARMYPVIREVVDAEVGRRSLAAPRAEVRIVPAVLGLDAPLIGASESAFESLLADPAAWLATTSNAAALDERVMSGAVAGPDREASETGTRSCRMKGVA